MCVFVSYIVLCSHVYKNVIHNNMSDINFHPANAYSALMYMYICMYIYMYVYM